MRRASPNKRQLRLITGFDGDSTVSLYIQDSGPGIAAKDRDRILDPFFTTKPTGMGLGLGLGEKDQVLLALTLFIGVITLGTSRTTVLQGIVHLASQSFCSWRWCPKAWSACVSNRPSAF
jgi:sensor histidine kinase regulating citrate/malate metabolism